MELQAEQRTTPNGAVYISKIYKRPGLMAWAVAGEVDSFTMRVDGLMTFAPGEVREIAAALMDLADHMEELNTR